MARVTLKPYSLKSMNKSDFQTLRQKYPIFSYESYTWKIDANRFHAQWNFINGEHKYQPSITLSLTSPSPKINKNAIDTLVFHLGLAEIFSYWKATISPKILIRAGVLTPEQVLWWEKLHLNGMGQFFYENHIDDFLDSFHWINKSSSPFSKISLDCTQKTNLVLLGGGKDSFVTSQLLTEHQQNIAGFSLNSTPVISRMKQEFCFQNLTIAERTIDPTLINLNSQGYLNGHTPFSSYLAFAGLLAAYLHGYQSVISSNEASSEEGNTILSGLSINHQYSKTLEFEKDFQSYLSDYFSSQISYFSLLRPLYELQISGIFSLYPKYFSSFRSCNIGQRSDAWCGNCPKCLSVYLLLSPYLEISQLNSIFGQDVLTNSKLLPIFQAMVENDKARPFECIGTRDETIVAAYLTLNKYGNNPPILLKYFQEKILPRYQGKLNLMTKDILTHFGDHTMPPNFSQFVKQALPIKLQ